MPTVDYSYSQAPDLYHIAASMEARARALRSEAEQLERDATAIRECAKEWHEKHPTPPLRCAFGCPPYMACRH